MMNLVQEKRAWHQKFSAPRRRQHGFGLVPAMVACAFLLAAAAMLAGIRYGAIQSEDSKAIAMAHSYVGQAMGLTDAFQMLLQQGATPDSITHDSGVNGIYSVGIPDRKVPPFGRSGGSTYWVYRKDTLQFPGVGNSGNGDYAFVSTIFGTGIATNTAAVCSEINRSAGKSITIRINETWSTVTGGAGAETSKDNTVLGAATPLSLQPASAAAAPLSMYGCLYTSDGSAVVYVIVQPV